MLLDLELLPGRVTDEHVETRVVPQEDLGEEEGHVSGPDRSYLVSRGRRGSVRERGGIQMNPRVDETEAGGDDSVEQPTSRLRSRARLAHEFGGGVDAGLVGLGRQGGIVELDLGVRQRIGDGRGQQPALPARASGSSS